MRIVALSDLHGYLPAVPPCDLLIVAGDLCVDEVGHAHASFAPDQQARWFERYVRPWFEAAPATHKVMTWGNHDWCGEQWDFSNDAPDRAATGAVQIVVDGETSVPRPGSSGTSAAGTVRVWATPWSNHFMDWAFMKSPAELADIYAAIPAGIDILVSHQPPHGYGDLSVVRGAGESEHHGSRELLAAIKRVRPRLVIAGHIHEGHGRYEYDGIPIYNVSVVDEAFRLVHEPTVITLT
jgi:3',5'-cyclic AMP phosphodiesterase CpdA